MPGRTKKERNQTMSRRFKTMATKKVKKAGKMENNKLAFQRKKAFYSDPARGGKGLCIKPSRMMRYMREERESFPEEFRVLLIHSEGKKKKFSDSFQRVAVGGLDALANRSMEVASLICASRTRRKPEEGLPVSGEDMTNAVALIKMFGR